MNSSPPTNARIYRLPRGRKKTAGPLICVAREATSLRAGTPKTKLRCPLAIGDIIHRRFLYGEFAQAKLVHAIETAELDGVAKVMLVAGEAIDVERLGESYCVSILHAGHPVTIEARAVLLAVGRPPFGSGGARLFRRDKPSGKFPTKPRQQCSGSGTRIPGDLGRRLCVTGSSLTGVGWS